MKAERRHELRENDLQHALEATRDYLNENGARIGVVAVALLAIVAAISFGVRSRTAAYEDTWRRKSQLTFEDVSAGRESLKKLATLTAETSDDAFILSSLIDQGRQALRLAQQVPFPPDPELNAHAREALESLRARYPDNPMAVGIASLGLATVEENEYAIDRDPAHQERARALLASVVQNPMLAGLPFQQLAADRLESLDATFSEVVHVAPVAPPEEAQESELPVDEPDPAPVDVP